MVSGLFGFNLCDAIHTVSIHFSVIYKTVLEFIALLFIIHKTIRSTCRILFSESLAPNCSVLRMEHKRTKTTTVDDEHIKVKRTKKRRRRTN